jgi:putative inorganic carbon (hco3(-)) transporter
MSKAGFQAFLLEAEFWTVGGLAVGAVFFQRLLPFVPAVAVVFWLMRCLVTGRRNQRTPLDFSIALLVLILPLSLWASSTPEWNHLTSAWIQEIPENARIQAWRLLGGIAVMYAIIHWGGSIGHLRLLNRGISLAGLLLSIFAIFSVQWAAGKTLFIPGSAFERFTLTVSDAVNPNVLAGCLILLLPFPAVYLWTSWREMGWLDRTLAGVSLLAMGLMVLLAQARGAWIALGFAILVLFSLRYRWGWLLIIAVFAALAAVQVWFRSTAVGYLLLAGLEGVVLGRQEIWERAVFLIQHFPLSGVGLGSFGEAVKALYPFEADAAARIPHAHNLFLQIGVDMGIPGLIAWLAAWLGVLASAWGLLKAEKGLLVNAIGSAFIASQVALAVHGITDAVTWGMVRSAPIVWAIWGVVLAAVLVSHSHPKFVEKVNPI